MPAFSLTLGLRVTAGRGEGAAATIREASHIIFFESRTRAPPPALVDGGTDATSGCGCDATPGGRLHCSDPGAAVCVALLPLTSFLGWQTAMAARSRRIDELLGCSGGATPAPRPPTARRRARRAERDSGAESPGTVGDGRRCGAVWVFGRWECARESRGPHQRLEARVWVLVGDARVRSVWTCGLYSCIHRGCFGTVDAWRRLSVRCCCMVLARVYKHSLSFILIIRARPHIHSEGAATNKRMSAHTPLSRKNE